MTAATDGGGTQAQERVAVLWLDDRRSSWRLGPHPLNRHRLARACQSGVRVTAIHALPLGTRAPRPEFLWLRTSREASVPPDGSVGKTRVPRGAAPGHLARGCQTRARSLHTTKRVDDLVACLTPALASSALSKRTMNGAVWGHWSLHGGGAFVLSRETSPLVIVVGEDELPRGARQGHGGRTLWGSRWRRGQSASSAAAAAQRPRIQETTCPGACNRRFGLGLDSVWFRAGCAAVPSGVLKATPPR
jgi:hypothetical protein